MIDSNLDIEIKSGNCENINLWLLYNFKVLNKYFEIFTACHYSKLQIKYILSWLENIHNI